MAQAAIDDTRLLELRKSGIVRPAAEPAVASRVGAAGDPLFRGLLPESGFPAGCITEIRGDASSGRLTLAVRMLLRALAASERAALVTSPEFFPGLAPRLASALHGALVCRMRCIEDGLGAAEVLATSGAVDLLVIDAVGLRLMSDARVPDATIARIERAARAEGVAVVILTNATAAHAIGLGSKSAIRLETDCATIGTPDGVLRPRLTLTRSRFARVQPATKPRNRLFAARG